MAVVTWNTATAGGGTGTGNWSVDVNWVGGTQPVTNDDVSIPGTGQVSAFTVTYDITSSQPALDSLTIGDGTAAPITLAIGANILAVTGTGLGFTQTITLQEAGGATITINGGTIIAG